MKNLTKISLGILTSVGGYLEAGSLGTALQAGANFRYELLWALALGTVCVAFLIEMSGRLAAVSKHTMVAAVRERFGFSFHVWPLSAQLLVDLLVLASEIAGASLALSLMTGVPMPVFALPVGFLIWILLWGGTFATIENGVAVLGLITLSFVAAAWRLGPEWRDALSGLIPHRPALDSGLYAYQAVSIIGATISPYMVTFYSSGAIEEKWTTKDVLPNRIVAALGMSFGSLVSMSVVIVAAVVLARKGITADTYQQAAGVMSTTFGHWGFWLFCGSLFIGCVGAALELSLDLSYLVAQTFGWNWGEDMRPSQEARFPLVYTGALLVAVVPALAGVDPLKFTMFSMVATVVALPIVAGPLPAVMNDKQYLKTQTNGWISNTAVTLIVALAFVLALLAIPVQLAGR